MIDNIDVFTQSSIRIRGREYTVYIDPYQMKEAPKDADYILITHDHFDHFSPEDIAKVSKENSVLIVPENMRQKALEAAELVGKIVTVELGDSYQIDGLEFETVPAYNLSKPFHPREAGWVGYILHVDGKRIYVSGDTNATVEAKQVKCDIALVPVGGTYTMDAKEAAGLINVIRPDVAIPTHYGSIVGKKEDARIFAANVADPVRVKIKKQY